VCLIDSSSTLLSYKRAKTWFDEKYQKQLGKRQTERKIMIQPQINESREKYASCRKETRKLIRAKKRRYKRQKYEAMDRDRPKPGYKEFYISCEKRGFKPRSIPTLKNNQGHMIR